MRRVAVVVSGAVLSSALIAFGVGPAAGAPGALSPASGDQAYNVLVPGQSGSLPANAHSTDQVPLYDGLTPLFNHVTEADIPRFFKPETLGDTSGTPEPVPRKGLKILRDNFDVPHIFGKSRADVEFGAGWVSAEDRSLIMEAIRGPARLAALDAPGIDAFALAGSFRTFKPTVQTEQFLANQLKLSHEFGAEGKQVKADATSYVSGINAYYGAIHSPAAPWTLNDVVASSALIGAVFGRGGGNEAANSAVLASLQHKLGQAAGLATFRDLRLINDPEAPTTLSQRFNYEPVPAGPTPGSVVIDPGSLQQVSALTPRRHMSNALIVSAGRAADHRPLAVMGPQVGYFYPEILLEMDLHGGGLDARGTSFPGTSLYVELGRGKTYAWSATSSGSDNVDQFVDQLCNPDGTPPSRQSDHYLFDGKCVAMTTFDAGLLQGTPGHPDKEVVFHQTVHGPVSGTVTVNGRPYAVTTERSTRGREPVSAIAFAEFNENKASTPTAFLHSASKIEYTFNWFWADNHATAYYSSGRLPLRAAGTDPSLPTIGTGQWEWQGWLSFDGHPHTVDPPEGLLLNWNNKPAPAFGSADDNWGTGPIDHVELFWPFRAVDNQLNDVVSIMNKAATQDDRAVLVWPTVARMLASGPAPDALTGQAAHLVTQWVAQGGSVLDRNGDGKVDAPGAAILDRAWSGIVHAVLSPVLGTVLGQIPGGGAESYVDKDLRDILGDPVRGPFSRRYCGGGQLSACRASLWAAMKAAADQLAAAQGPDPTAWRAAAQRIGFTPGLLPNTIAFTNRPTFQQVIEFGR